MLIAAKKRHSGGPGAGLEGPGAGAAGAGGALTQLSFYRDQPNEDLTLEDFEILAFNRVKRACRAGAGQGARAEIVRHGSWAAR